MRPCTKKTRHHLDCPSVNKSDQTSRTLIDFMSYSSPLFKFVLKCRKIESKVSRISILIIPPKPPFSIHPLTTVFLTVKFLATTLLFVLIVFNNFPPDWLPHFNMVTSCSIFTEYSLRPYLKSFDQIITSS